MQCTGVFGAFWGIRVHKSSLENCTVKLCTKASVFRCAICRRLAAARLNCKMLLTIAEVCAIIYMRKRLAVYICMVLAECLKCRCIEVADVYDRLDFMV